MKIAARSAESLAELRDTKTTTAIIKALPFESIAHHWEDEIYFDIHFELELENGKEVLDIETFFTGRLAEACAFSSVPRPQARARR